jgi:methylglutaconyl-CoA hydratase
MSDAGNPLLFETTGAVARLTLNRPGKRNALDPALIRALADALDRAGADPSLRVVTLAGAGADFCAGADLGALRATMERSVVDNLEDVDELAGLFLRIRHLRKPVVALVRGRALAGGCGLATACDLVLAAEHATFGYPEIRIGFVPAMVMAVLRRCVPEKRAFEMIATGDTFTARDAERFGLVNRVLPDDRFEAEAEAFVADLALRSGSALLLAKRLLYHQDGMTYEAAVRAGADVNVIARMTQDTRAGIERFLEGGGGPPKG